MKKYLFSSTLLLLSLPLLSQVDSQDKISGTLPEVVDYAVDHSPLLKQSDIDQQLTDLRIKNQLTNNLPQLSLGYNYQYNFVRPDLANGQLDHMSGIQLNASQNILNRDIWFTKKTAEDNRKLSSQTKELNEINLIAETKKAFYDALITQQQITLSQQDIERISKSLEMATYQYKGGIVDKTDNRRAGINLNNSKAQKYSAEESYKAKITYLKQIMGYPSEEDLSLQYDFKKLEEEALVILSDTLYLDNIADYQYLKTQQKLKEAEVDYNKKSWLPNIAANAGYNMNFLDNDFAQLYQKPYNGAFVGLGLSWSILQGGKRKNDAQITQLQIERLQEEEHNLVNSLQSQYKQAVNRYNAAMYNFEAIRDNVKLSEEVYDVINLQYKAGVKTYLEVFSAETDLRNARTNYLNALYSILSTKVDLEKTLGLIKTNH